ncbi:Class II abasic (AP) endonuclease [Tulasnella sp. 418]|nr:Class II abasic (AP) endonuclease [Tulasnella sp. 418]
MNFNRLLQERVRILIEDEKREVIVVGDINVAADPLDHGEGQLKSGREGFWDHPARAWFRKWLSPNGPMVDVIRSFWPGRQGMFTCWNTVLNAREANYGARIDYILVTKGLVPFVKAGDIQADVRGSDHCPIYIDLHDEITSDEGQLLRLIDLMKGSSGGESDALRQPPRIAAQFWDEFSGKQTLLSKFFTKKQSPASSVEPTEKAPTEDIPITNLTVDTQSQGSAINEPSPSSQPAADDAPSQAESALLKTIPRSRPSEKALGKRKVTASGGSQDTLISSKKKKGTGQASISSFFISSKADSTAKSVEKLSRKGSKSSLKTSSSVIVVDDEQADIEDESSSQNPINHIESDYQFALSLAEAEENKNVSMSSKPHPVSSTGSEEHKKAWDRLLAPLEAPLCTVHQEPTKRFTVNKPGPNKGKTFFVCSRPVGPGYDKGKSKRLREEVDPRYRCDFFKWANDVKKVTNRS